MKAFFLIFVLFLMMFVNAQATDKSACDMPKEVGPCRKSDLKFYYDSNAKECKEFFYGGCQGNDNRFQDKNECEKLCL